MRIWGRIVLNKMQIESFIFNSLGVKIDLLNVNSVHDFSNGSVAVYVSNKRLNCPETIINLNVIDAPNGIYTLNILPATDNGTQDNFYNLIVNTEFAQPHEKDDADTTSAGKRTNQTKSQEIQRIGNST